MADISQGILSLINSFGAIDNSTNERAISNSQSTQAQLQTALMQQQIKAQQANLAARTQAVNDYLASDQNDPDRSIKYNRLMTLAPDLRESAKQGYDAMSEDAQKQYGTDLSTTYGYAKAGDWDNLIPHIQSVIDTDVKNGKSADQDKAYLELVKRAKAGDANAARQAQNMSEIAFASVYPDKFDERYKAIELTPSEIAKNQAAANADNAQASIAPSQIAKNLADSAKANSEATPFTPVTDADGNPQAFDKRNGNITGSEDQSQAAQSIAQSTAAILGTETNPNQSDSVRNPLSSATGRGQFIDTTWEDTIRKDFPEIAKGKSKEQILALRSNPELSQQVANEYNKKNLYSLNESGLPINNTTAAMAYKLGVGGGGAGTNGAGAKEVLDADPSTPLSKILPPKVLAANPQLFTKDANGKRGRVMTAGEYTQSMMQQIPPNPIKLADKNSTGAEFLNSLPRGRANLVQSIARGDVAPPVGRSGVTEMGSGIMSEVLKYDPSFVQNRYELNHDLSDTSKPNGKSLAAQNTLIPHLVEYADLVHQLNATSPEVGNFIGNVASRLTGGRRSGIIKKMNDLKVTIGNERAAVFGADSEKSREDLSKQLDPSTPRDQLYGVIQQVARASQDKVNSIFQQYQQAAKMPADVNKYIYPSTQAALRHLESLTSTREPNRNEIIALTSNPTPQNRKYFDATFGSGKADHYLTMGARH